MMGTFMEAVVEHRRTTGISLAVVVCGVGYVVYSMYTGGDVRSAMETLMLACGVGALGAAAGDGGSK